MYIYSLETFIPKQINQIALEVEPTKPRLNFATKKKKKIQDSRKTATTRLKDEKDPSSDLDLITLDSVVSATSFKTVRQFASLKITKI
jgi:hypothetical protein